MTNLEKYKNEIAAALAADSEGIICDSFKPNVGRYLCDGCVLEHVKCSNKEAVLAWLDKKNDE